MKMKKQLDIKKLLLLNMPYILMGLFATNFGEAMADGRGCGRFGKNALVLLHAAGGAGQLVAQPAPAGPAGGAVLRRWPAIGRVSQKQERQEVPARHGVWHLPAGAPMRTLHPTSTRCSRTM